MLFTCVYLLSVFILLRFACCLYLVCSSVYNDNHVFLCFSRYTVACPVLFNIICVLDSVSISAEFTHLYTLHNVFFLTCSVSYLLFLLWIYGTLNKITITITINNLSLILDKWPTWRTILFYVFIYIFNSLHVSSTSCSSSGETNCVNTTSGSCHSVSVTVSCAGRKWTSDLHTTRPPTVTRGWIDTICLSRWWARCARNM